jgi:hypothetical protein
MGEEDKPTTTTASKKSGPHRGARYESFLIKITRGAIPVRSRYLF